MPIYDFECNLCGHLEEVVQPMSAPSQKNCPQCKEPSFKVVILTAPATIVKGEVKTIGQQAEKNTKNMGTYELEDKRFKDDLNKGISDQHKKTRDRHKSIVSMTPQQQQHWIKTGEKPK